MHEISIKTSRWVTRGVGTGEGSGRPRPKVKADAAEEEIEEFKKPPLAATLAPGWFLKMEVPQ